MRRIYFLTVIFLFLSSNDILAQGPPPDEPCPNGEPYFRIFPDKDGDFYGTLQGAKWACSVETGYVVNFLDCNDNDATVHPGATEIYCDGKDNDCNGVVDYGTRLYVKWNASGSGDGSSWTNAFTKLQDALTKAATCNTIVEIWVAAGTYYPDEGAGFTNDSRTASFNLKNGLTIYGGFAGTETSIFQRNWISNITILSGEIQNNANIADNSIHLVTAAGVNNTAILDGFTVTGGNANANAPNDDGGGLYITNSSPQIRNCIFSNNRSSDSGGAVGNTNAGSSPTFLYCSFTANTCNGFIGGGAFSNIFGASITFTNCKFSGNTSGAGGAGYTGNSSSSSLINCSFWNNSATQFGGAIYNGSGAATTSIVNCSFSGNTGNSGGAIYNLNNSSLVLTNCIVWDNTGGEIVNNTGTSQVNYSIVKGGYTGTGNLDVNPLFVNAGSGDLHLQSCSPGIDAGNNAVVTESADLGGNTRILNATNDVSAIVDRGPYEFTGTATSSKYYRDADGDGHGDANNPLRSCSAPGGYVAGNNDDCNDNDGSVYAGAPEVCDGKDNDCDGTIDDGNTATIRLYVNKQALPGGNGSSWENAFKYLQDALAAAGCGTEIWVAQGVYYPDEGSNLTNNDRNLSFEMKNTVAIYGGFNGTESSLSQRQWRLNPTYLSGDLLQDNSNYFIENNGGILNAPGDNSYHVVKSGQTNQTSVLDGFIIAAGNANGSGTNSVGGGMYAVGSSMILTNCEFRYNRADKGGGLYHSQSGLVIDKCIFRSNSVVTGGGGAYITNESYPYLYNCIFQANNVENTTTGHGGGVAVYLNSAPEFINCTFGSNYAKTAGAFHCSDNANPIVYNTIMWKDESGSPRSFSNPVAAVNNSALSYYYSLVYGLDLSGSNNNLNGTGGGTLFWELEALFPDAPGYLQDLTVLVCSPTIDHGSNGYLASETDVAGKPRFVNTTVDMGAFEFQGTNGITYYQDKDRDGWGNENVSLVSCTQPAGYVTKAGDCNDEPGDPEDPLTWGASTNPDRFEICDGQDNDCNGVVDDIYTYYYDGDNDGLGNPHNKKGSCTQTPPEHYVANDDDCNDADNTNSSTVIYVNVNAPGSVHDGSSWATAYKTLQDALTYICPNIREIWVAKGTYYPDKGAGVTPGRRGEAFIMKNNLAIYGGFNGNESLLSQRNWKTNITTLSGDIDEDGTLNGNSFHVVLNDGNGLNNSAKLDGFHITGGNASNYTNLDNPEPYYTGAGMRNKNSAPLIANCVFESNSAYRLGGAVYNEVTSATSKSIFENCEFRSNRSTGASNSSGGAVYNTGAGGIQLTNCLFFDNAAIIQGGAICNLGVINVTNCSFFDNRSTTNGKHIFSNSATEAAIVNSILWGSNSPIDATSVAVSYSIVQQVSGVFAGTGNLNTDPTFEDQATGDLRLRSNSPAINVGSDAANSTNKDLAVNPRKVGVIDMGAYEYQTASGCTDETVPAFTGSYADVNLGCNPANAAGSLGSATATDASGSVTITSSDGPVVSDGCNRSQTRSFIAADGCQNTSTISRTVRWMADNTPPVFTGNYGDINLGCNPVNPSASLGTATATDGCGSVTITSVNAPIQSSGCNRSQTITFTAKDGCNNTATTSRTVRWKDDDDVPVFTGSYADIDLGCNPVNPSASLGTATATDACGAVTISSVNAPIQSSGCNRSQTITFTAKDGCNNTAITSRTVRWKEDDAVPVFTGSYADIDLGCNPISPSASLGSATATDACGAVTITSVNAPIQSSGCNRSQTITFTAKDGCNNTATTSRTVRWKEDDAVPVFTGSYADIDLGCNPISPSASLGSATATDACGAVTITSVNAPIQSSGCNRSQTITFTAKDGCNNTATTSRTVRWIVDNIPATFTGSYADVNLGCNPADPNASLGSATATDVCGSVTITHMDGTVITTGCNRSVTRVFTATDGCQNTSSTSRTVRWIADNIPATFTGSYADVNLGCNPADPNASLGSATATDICGAVTITHYDGAVQSSGCNRWITRTFTAKDGCQNTSSTSRTVRWIYDKTPATFTGSYADVDLGCNPLDPAASLGSATATDVCGTVTITHTDGAVQSSNCNRWFTRTFTATDGCLNTSSTSRTVRWIYDKTPPTLNCAQTGTITRSTNAGQCTYTVNGTEFNSTVSDACSTPILAWAVTGATATSGTTTMAGVQLNFGNNTVIWTATDGCNNTSTCSFVVNVNKVTTTTSLVVSTTPATNPVTQQYSDKITCVATVTPANCTGAGFIGGKVIFKIITPEGTVLLDSANVGPDGRATITDTLLENKLYPGSTNLTPTNGPLKPGNKMVTAEYKNTNQNYIVTNPTAPLVVTCEDAEVTYNGLSYFGANPNTNQGTVTVSAFVLDTNDVNDNPAQGRGDIRNATVTFKEGSGAGALIGTANIPVGLVNPTNFQEGIVTSSKLYTLSTQDISCGGKIIDVWAGVNNYYCGEIGEVVPVCLSLPGGDFVTGGGWIKMQNSEGSYAGTDDKKMHAALVFKWNKSNKNLQGNATITYKRVVNGVTKVYQVKSNSIQSMIVNNVNDAGVAVTTGATYRMAQIVTKANFRDLTDPDFPVALFGNLTLTITAWESINTTDGSKDRVSIQLAGTGSQGLIFSSNWVGGTTQWQQLGGGKMRVRNPSAEIPCTNCSGSSITKTIDIDKSTKIAVEATEISKELKVAAMPNPSYTHFNILAKSNDKKEKILVQVSDALGRIVEARSMYADEILRLGDRYRPGIYFARFIQGKRVTQLKLIKSSD